MRESASKLGIISSYSIEFSLPASKMQLAIDYEKRLVSVEIDPQSNGGAPPPIGFVVPVAVQGVPIRLLVDTGFPDILLYKEWLRSGLPHLRTEENTKRR